MGETDRARLWRFLSFAAAPFLTIVAVLLLRDGETWSYVLGAILLVAAVAAIAGPLLLQRRG